jgi:hypothetical protein
LVLLSLLMDVGGAGAAGWGFFFLAYYWALACLAVGLVLLAIRVARRVIKIAKPSY